MTPLERLRGYEFPAKTHGDRLSLKLTAEQAMQVIGLEWETRAVGEHHFEGGSFLVCGHCHLFATEYAASRQPCSSMRERRLVVADGLPGAEGSDR